MDVREKLVELLKEIVAIQECGFGDPRPTYETVASYLMSHGVTVQELDGCKYCRTASYTEKPFIVITQMGKEVKTQFNFCPNCGRRLRNPQKGE